MGDGLTFRSDEAQHAAAGDPGVTDRGAGGPWFDELRVGQTFTAPAYTLSEGRAAVHQSIVGDRLALPLDESLARAVSGSPGFAHPAFVWNVAIGQSTVATRRVKANLFYRGLAFRRFPHLGDTVRTTTEVVGLRQNAIRAGRTPTGLAALRMTTVDQHDRPVLDFVRCAMLPLSHEVQTGHADDLDAIGPADRTDLTDLSDLSDLSSSALALEHLPETMILRPGDSWAVAGGDVVSNAPELARLTLNVAAVHHDAAAAGGERLVYGGHTIAIALAQASRALPGLVTVLGWHGCDHTGPVHEGDTLRSTVTVEQVDGSIAHLRSVVTADPDRPVLDWRYVAVVR